MSGWQRQAGEETSSVQQATEIWDEIEKRLGSARKFRNWAFICDTETLTAH